MNMRLILSLGLLLQLHSTLLLAAETAPVTVAKTPSAAEWAPVQQAIDANQPNAQAQLLALLKTYPAWGDGNKTLARLLLEQGKAAEALVAAKRANQITPDDSEALRIQIRALTDLERKADIYTLIDQSAGKDPKGWLRYEAGLAAVRFNDAVKAEKLFKEAQSRAGAKTPPEFLMLDSRVAILARDFARAELALASATAQQPDFWDGWYELGRVRLVLADRESTQRETWVKKAGEAFGIVVKNVPGDAAGHLGQGRVALEQAKQLTTAGQDDNAGGKLRDAEAAFHRALTIKPDHAEAYVLLGDVQLRLEKWDAAVTALQRAKGLGANDRSLTFNLAIALQQTGKADQAAALLNSITAASTAEQVTLGMGAYRSKNWLLAATLLPKAVEQLENAEAEGATWRFIGHARSRLAEARTGAEREQWLDAAAEAYRNAGGLLDFPARRFFIASEAARSPERAYAAAWTMISWDPLTLSAWGQVIAHYGAAKTGGQGLGGMAQRAPLHLAVWCLLVVAPLAFFGLGLLRRRNRPESPTPARAGRPQADKRPISEPVPTRQPTPRQAVTPVKPRRPPVQPKTGPNKIIPASKVQEKAETEAHYAPTPKPRLQPGTRTPGKGGTTSAADQTMQPNTGPDMRPQSLERRPRPE